MRLDPGANVQVDLNRRTRSDRPGTEHRVEMSVREWSRCEGKDRDGKALEIDIASCKDSHGVLRFSMNACTPSNADLSIMLQAIV